MAFSRSAGAVQPGALAAAATRLRAPSGGAYPGAAFDTKDLGERTFEGVSATGVRHIATLPAGAIGNELPIEIVSERWYSADLDALVLRRTSDPRFGGTYRP
jgi:hypothetical protein